MPVEIREVPSQARGRRVLVVIGVLRIEIQQDLDLYDIWFASTRPDASEGYHADVICDFLGVPRYRSGNSWKQPSEIGLTAEFVVRNHLALQELFGGEGWRPRILQLHAMQEARDIRMVCLHDLREINKIPFLDETTAVKAEPEE